MVKKTLIELVPTVLAAGRLSVRSYLLPRMGDNIPNLSQREVLSSRFVTMYVNPAIRHIATLHVGVVRRRPLAPVLPGVRLGLGPAGDPIENFSMTMSFVPKKPVGILSSKNSRQFFIALDT